jgi:hypothetical protein
LIFEVLEGRCFVHEATLARALRPLKEQRRPVSIALERTQFEAV